MIARLELCLYSGVLRRTLSRGTTACLLCGVGPQGLGGAGGGRAARGCCAVCAVFVGILGGFKAGLCGGVLGARGGCHCTYGDA